MSGSVRNPIRAVKGERKVNLMQPLARLRVARSVAQLTGLSRYSSVGARGWRSDGHVNISRSRRGQQRNYASVTEAKEEDKREKVVILGSGWAGYVLSRNLSPQKYSITVVSPRSYFVFTPLLNDTAVGTLEFRNVLESVRRPNSLTQFLQGWADGVDFVDKTVAVEPSVLDPDVGRAMTGPRDQEETSELQTVGGLFGEKMHDGGKGETPVAFEMGGTGQTRVPTFAVKYDKLVIAVGCYSQTFGTKGVKENAMFLKDVGDARRIRRRVLELFELAQLPILDDDVKRHLLHFAVVGGGPTGMEFAACLSDLISEDLKKMYPDLMKFVQITLYDVAPKVLPMFDAALTDYAVKTYKRLNIDIKTSHHVEELRMGFPNDADAAANQDKQVKGRVYTIRTKEEGDVGIGMCVWSTGNMNNPFVAKALDHVRRYPVDSADITQGEVEDPMKKQWTIQRDPKSGSMMVDDHFRIQLQSGHSGEVKKEDASVKAVMQDVFALGDDAMMLSGPLPGTAQAANQQGQWLAKNLNKSSNREEFEARKGFTFQNLGGMTYLGDAKAIFQNPNPENGVTKGVRGWFAYLMWRGAYLTMTLSWRNKVSIPYQWLLVRVFGRHVSRF